MQRPLGNRLTATADPVAAAKKMIAAAAGNPTPLVPSSSVTTGSEHERGAVCM